MLTESVCDSTAHQKSRTSTTILAQAAVTPFGTRMHQPNESRTSPVPGQWTWTQYATVDSGHVECRTLYLLYWEFRRRLSAHWQWWVGVTKWTGKHINNICEMYEALSIYLSVNSATKNLHVLMLNKNTSLMQLISCIKLVFLFIIIWCTETQNWNIDNQLDATMTVY